MFSGTVIKGKQIARLIGFPTANVVFNDPNHLYPFGVYHGLINNLNCIIYITNQLIECHIPNWNGDLYDQTVNIEIKTFIRNDISFEYLDQVVSQIKKDMIIYNLIIDIETFQNSNLNFVSFSGGKESCILIDILHRLNIPFDVIHFKPKELDCCELEYMNNFLNHYNKKLIIKEYTSFEQAVKEYDYYDNCFLGVRRDDSSFKDSTWLRKCKIIKPLFEWKWLDVWNYIDNFNVIVNEKYSLGYTSVGYNCKPNILLKRFDNGYMHAKYLTNFEMERK